jgi:hypothetical protein
LLCLWLRQKPASNEIIVRRTRSRSRMPRSFYRTGYRTSWEEVFH